ncbi:formiminoglutamase [Kaistella treverensis]|uniref:Formimidoylglutamase n=1 Tax=Kaistella treverensis TaxID=631455 RepID=A0A1I3MN77_9FLAO|nr:formimidoylglutamase [Kaistella treverensis]SFI98584.1 formiminoglutamase [Kaistella treverensis]
MIWQGRFDGEEPLYHRVFQRVTEESSYEIIKENDFVLHGFAVDEGVKRNKGRQGAKNAPDIVRKSTANFPVVNPHFVLKDFGNIFCEDGDLDKSQKNLAEAVKKTLEQKGKSLVFGGGHEVMFAHFSGIKAAFPEKKIGIINFDAHFDNREIDKNIGATSGTGFWQIAQQEKLHSLHIGIQRNSNTLKLFDSAHQMGMKYILAEEIFFENLPVLYPKIEEFIADVDLLYITICMDVFNAAIAPGVSAPAYNGIFADAAFMHIYKHIFDSNKVIALDVAEVNPNFDENERTARLAAALVNEWFMATSF